MTQKRHSSSFMIEDILGTSSAKTPRTHTNSLSDVTVGHPPSPPSKASYCYSLPQRYPGAIPFTVQFSPQSVPLYEPPSGVFAARNGGYTSPAGPRSPSFAQTSRDMLAFFPHDFGGNFLAARHELMVQPPMFGGSPVVLDLSNCGPKGGSLHQAVSSLSSPVVEGSRHIFWKHIPRNPAKRKGGQIRFSSDQTTTLENTFNEHKYLSSNERKRLAVVLKLSERQVKTWFQNRRAKWRRIKQEPLGPVSSPESECRTS